MIDAGLVRSVDHVREELGKRDDAVRAWADARPALFIALDDVPVLTATKAVLAAHPKLLGVGKGRNGADPFVTGLARARGGRVVTEERPSGRLDRPRFRSVRVGKP